MRNRRPKYLETCPTQVRWVCGNIASFDLCKPKGIHRVGPSSNLLMKANEHPWKAVVSDREETADNGRNSCFQKG